MRVNRKRTQHHVRCLLCLLGGDEVDAAATHALGSRYNPLILRRPEQPLVLMEDAGKEVVLLRIRGLSPLLKAWVVAALTSFPQRRHRRRLTSC